MGYLLCSLKKCCRVIQGRTVAGNAIHCLYLEDLRGRRRPRAFICTLESSHKRLHTRLSTKALPHLLVITYAGPCESKPGALHTTMMLVKASAQYSNPCSNLHPLSANGSYSDMNEDQSGRGQSNGRSRSSNAIRQI